ncbi:hypothetical protein JCM6882_003165 [Rhodosporidiobolus microsporus]
MAPPLVLPPSPPLPPIPSTPPTTTTTSSSFNLKRSDTVRAGRTPGHSRAGSLAALAAGGGGGAGVQGPSSSSSSLAAGGAGAAAAGQQSTVAPSRLDLHLLPNPPQPFHLLPFLSPSSPLTPSEKRALLTSVYLRAASAGNADTLEWLLALPADPNKTPHENAVAQRRFSLTAAQLAQASSSSSGAASPGGVGLGLGGAGAAGGGAAGGAGPELPDSAPRKWVDLEATDEEGNTALGLCVALGHAEAVRVLVENGVRVNGPDRAGWTPLHWAVQNNDLPIAAYLLNHRASPLIASHKGLTPRDLVKPTPSSSSSSATSSFGSSAANGKGKGRGAGKGKGREVSAMAEVLESAWEAAVERERALRRAQEGEGADLVPGGGGDDLSGGGGSGSGRPSSRLSMASLAASGAGAGAGSDAERERESRREREKERRRRVQLGVDSAVNLEVELGVLGLEEEGGVGGGAGRGPDDDSDDPDRDDPSTDSDDEGGGGGAHGGRHPFVWDRCLPDQMLVFALTDLPTLFDVIITTIKPVRERKYRVIPANVLFLCARFAHYFGNEELLEELMIGAMERIEMAVHNRPDDMANCAFWLSNTLLLLYYLRKDPSLSSTPSVAQTYQTHLCDLINEIFVFVIRDAERRIDRVLEAALLEHEALPGFEDVAFEDEWASTRFVKKLTGRGLKKGGMRTSQSARSLFSTATSTSSESVLPGTDGSSPPPRQRHVSASQIPLADATPRSITALLSSTLFVLQLYEIPPSIVVQAFSQLFYWIACEVFNRLLTQRKYLCRSRAMQIRLNASNLEDWARANRLPTKMVSVHFTPLNQLLQWLQCLSSESSIDGLIGTVQSLRALNPLQLRKAVRDYRYEVDERRMDEDCAQYLVQIQKQWERMRMQKKVEGLGRGGGDAASGSATPVSLNGFDDGASGLAAASVAGSGAASPAVGGGGGGGVEDDGASVASAQEDVARMIDDVFADPSSFGSYAPPGGAEALGELLNSRYMLPFAVPTSAEMLVNFDQPDAFGPFAASAHSRTLNTASSDNGGNATPRSSSRLSYSSASRLSTPASSFSPASAPADDSASIASFSSSAAESRPPPPIPEPFTPVIPDDFFAVWDAAKAKAGHALRPSTSAALLAGVASWEESPAVEYTEWKARAATGEGGGVGEGSGAHEGGEEDDDAGSVVDFGAGEESEAGTSFGSEEGIVGGMDETPRPRTGFQP